jgi:lysophospholipase L1-like esterase
MPIPAGSRYVAMGSSFAAGPGLPSRVPGSPRRAGRSTGNYAHLVARALGLDLQDVTLSGATTSDILRPPAAGRAAQLDAVTPETSLVTITAGGNDVGYLPRLTLASVPWPLRALPPVTARVDTLGETSTTDERFEQLGRNLTRSRADCGIVPPPAASSSSTTCRSCPRTALPPPRRRPKSRRGGRAIAARLAAVTQAAAATAGWTYIAASAASAGHHAWSAAPWTRRFHLSLRGGAPYHPNAAGMAAVAELVLAKLAEDR